MLRVRTVMTGVGGSPWYTNMYFGGDDSQTQAQAAATRVRAFWSDLAPYISSGVNIDVQSDIPTINPATGVTFGLRTFVTAPVASSATTERLPMACQALIRLRSDGIVNGRRVLGRIFVPGINEGTSVNGQVNATDRANFDAKAATLAGYGTSADPRLVIWSRPVAGGRAGSIQPVTGVSTWSQWAILRSRRD